MHARGITVAPYLTNDWTSLSGINALNDRDALSTDLAAAVAANNLDGVNVDIENMTQLQRSSYVDFVRLLREKLPAGKTIAVAVASNPWGATTGWQGSYDYAGLAQYADYLMIMTYDEHYDGSVPGSVSSLSFMEKSIAYALTQVPKNKIVLGLPFYGRVWSSSGVYPHGYGVSDTKIEKLIQDYSGTVSVDNTSRSACAVITIKDSDQKPVVGGKALSAGTYTIWYENEQTLKERLCLVRKYDIKGAGSWSLGQEDDCVWNYYALWLNGCTFSDIENSWARDEIVGAYMKGWVNGISQDTFGPDAPLTRAQAAAIIVRMLGYPVEANDSYGFCDTKGSWAEDYISTARRYGIISGDGLNTFAPNKAVTRQEIAVMLAHVLSVSSVNQHSVFDDVSALDNPWSYDAISALSTNGVIAGYPDGTFRPTVNVTRAEMTVMLSRIKTP